MQTKGSVCEMTLKKKIFYLLAPLALGGVSALFLSDSMKGYASLPDIPLSPPGWIFPVVWSILYLLMGISAYLVAKEGTKEAKKALEWFWIQLLVNLVWPWFFFTKQWYAIAFFWLVFLFLLVLQMIRSMRKVNPTAAKLQIPYALWLIFAGYLNFSYYLLLG